MLTRVCSPRKCPFVFDCEVWRTCTNGKWAPEGDDGFRALQTRRCSYPHAKSGGLFTVCSDLGMRTWRRANGLEMHHLLVSECLYIQMLRPPDVGGCVNAAFPYSTMHFQAFLQLRGLGHSHLPPSVCQPALCKAFIPLLFFSLSPRDSA